MPLYDIVIRGGRVVGPDFHLLAADVGIAGDRIAAVGSLGRCTARREIAAEGMVVSPGFIDVHSHSDLACLVRADSKLLQGVTTEIVGNCGQSTAPASPELRRELAADIKRYRQRISWRSVRDYLVQVDRVGCPSNVGLLVGHGTLRHHLGCADGPLSLPERQALAQAAQAAMDEGALGISSGLYYCPGWFADDDELEALTAVAAQRGAVWAVHLRGETLLLLAALAEVIAVARATGVRLQVSHLKAAGTMDHGRMPALLAQLERCPEATADVYPYVLAQTSLEALLPPGGTLDDEKGLIERLSAQGPDWDNLGLSCGWDRVTVGTVRQTRHRRWCGCSIADVAAELGVDPAAAVVRLVAMGEGQAAVLFELVDERDLVVALRWQRSMIASDASAVGRSDNGFVPGAHPRAAGTFPRVLGRYVGRGPLTLEEAIWKMSGFPAAVVGLPRRGRIDVGAYADLVVFDPGAIHDRATMSAPELPPEGIRYVLVNGRIAVEDGRAVDKTAGRAIVNGRE